MESIIIIIAGLIFSVISKSVKDKQEIEKERKKRKEQLGQDSYTSSSTPERTKKKQKSLRDIFVEELDKVGDEDGSLGDVFRRSLGEEPQKKIKLEQIEDINSIDDENMSEEEYRKALEIRNEAYMKSSLENENNRAQAEIVNGESKVKSEVVMRGEIGKIPNRQEYNPFTKSMNRKDIIRGIIFSEVLEKPKSLRN